MGVNGVPTHTHDRYIPGAGLNSFPEESNPHLHYLHFETKESSESHEPVRVMRLLKRGNRYQTIARPGKVDGAFSYLGARLGWITLQPISGADRSGSKFSTIQTSDLVSATAQTIFRWAPWKLHRRMDPGRVSSVLDSSRSTDTA